MKCSIWDRASVYWPNTWKKASRPEPSPVLLLCVYWSPVKGHRKLCYRVLLWFLLTQQEKHWYYWPAVLLCGALVYRNDCVWKMSWFYLTSCSLWKTTTLPPLSPVAKSSPVELNSTVEMMSAATEHKRAFMYTRLTTLLKCNVAGHYRKINHIKLILYLSEEVYLEVNDCTLCHLLHSYLLNT